MKRVAFVYSILILTVFQLLAQEPEKSVFYSAGNNRSWILYQNNNQSLYNIITNEAFYLLEQREERVNSLATKEDWINYQTEL
jgi:hypothetical protein